MGVGGWVQVGGWVGVGWVGVGSARPARAAAAAASQPRSTQRQTDREPGARGCDAAMRGGGRGVSPRRGAGRRALVLDPSFPVPAFFALCASSKMRHPSKASPPHHSTIWSTRGTLPCDNRGFEQGGSNGGWFETKGELEGERRWGGPEETGGRGGGGEREAERGAAESRSAHLRAP